MKQLQKKVKSGTLDVKKDDPFELFIAATSIRYCYYAESNKILGNTYGMLILQVCEWYCGKNCKEQMRSHIVHPLSMQHEIDQSNFISYNFPIHWKMLYFHFFSDISQKMKFSMKDFFSKCDQIRRFLRIWSHLLKKSLKEFFIFCAVWSIAYCAMKNVNPVFFTV